MKNFKSKKVLLFKVFPIFTRYTVTISYLKKGTIMKINSILTLFIIITTVIISYIILNNILLSSLILGAGILFFYLSQKNNLQKKENLNIIRDEKKLYFYLSDNLLFSVELLQDKTLTETVRESIEKEMNTLQSMTRKICFINFQNHTLLKELNHSLQNT